MDEGKDGIRTFSEITWTEGLEELELFNLKAIFSSPII